MNDVAGNITYIELCEQLPSVYVCIKFTRFSVTVWNMLGVLIVNTHALIG